MNKVNYQIILLYLAGIFFLYPVVAHILMYQLGFVTDRLPHGQTWIFIRIFVSGPALIILGLLLYFKHGGLVNRILGIVFLVIGLYWLYNVISDVIKEAA